MDVELINNLGGIGGVGGLSLGVILLVYREIIKKNIFPQLAKNHAYRLFLIIVILTWSMAMFGMAAWVWMEHESSSPQPKFTVRDFYDRFINASTQPEQKALLEELAVNLETSNPSEREVAAHQLAKLIIEYKTEIDGDQQKRRLREKILEILRKVASEKLYAYFDRSAFRGIDMAYFDFSGEILPHMNFQGAWLINADFSNADLDGSDFRGARLRGADFTGAKYIENANFVGSDWFNAIGLLDSVGAIKKLGHVATCPRTKDAMIRFHDNVYDIKFEELSIDLKNQLMRNWSVFLKNGICND